MWKQAFLRMSLGILVEGQGAGGARRFASLFSYHGIRSPRGMKDALECASRGVPGQRPSASLPEFLPYQPWRLVLWTKMVMTGNAELGFDSGEGA